MSKLSEVFSKLSKKPSTGPNSKILAGNRNNRIVAQTTNQKSKRNNQIQQARGIKSTPKKLDQISHKKRTPQSKAAIKGGKKGKHGNNKGKDQKKPVEKGDLDKEMDSYWFKAGKGPNPDLVQLDNQMDEYFNKKKSEDSAVVATTSADVDSST